MRIKRSSTLRWRFVQLPFLFFFCFLVVFLSLTGAFQTQTASHARLSNQSPAADEIVPSIVRFSENFDNVAAPALPSGWTTSNTGTANTAFVTSPGTPYSSPNAIFTNNPATAGSAEITSPNITLGNSRARLTFIHKYQTEFRSGFDGGVLEVSLNGGVFQDILAAGGSFAGGGYLQTITANANPLNGRLAWTGEQEYASTIVDLPLSFMNQTIRIRWRFGTNDSFGGSGWRIDNVKVEDSSPVITTFSENFDGVTTPNLPAGWTKEQTDEVRGFRTHTESVYSMPNSVFAPAPTGSGTAAIISPSIRLGANSPKLIFQHVYACDEGFKGGVLEISINGGEFRDILAAGGSFAHGGYNNTLNSATNPLNNRQAWTGSTNGFIITEINLPPNAYRQNVRFKWIFATDQFILSIGWWIDSIQVIESLSGENLNSISIPENGVAQPYPSQIQVTDHTGLITSVRVSLVNFSHASPDDVDLMLVAPSGRKVILMSDVGGANPVNNLALTFDDAATNSLPDNTSLSSGIYQPTNFEPGDNFPADAPGSQPSGNLLSVLNGSDANGTWKLYLVDDNGNNAGNISGGWNLSVQTAPDVVSIPAVGAAQPYPSDLIISGLPGSVSKVTVKLSNFSHTSPDDVDLMLVAPNGRRIVVMSDVGGNTEVGGLNITLDDDAAASLPDNAQLISGTFKPTNFESGDIFPAPAPQGAPTGTTLAHFFGTAPNGIWKLYAVDDTGENFGSIAGSWSLDIQSSVGTCQFSLSQNGQAFPASGGAGSFEVQIPSGCPWGTTVSGFINISSGSSGEGAGVVNFTVAPNIGGPPRTGAIVVVNGSFSRTFFIQQEASSLPPGEKRFDFDGDGKADISVFRPSSGNWFISNSLNNTLSVAQFGASGDVIAPADFDGDGKTDISVFRPSDGGWYRLNSSSNTFSATRFGTSGDLPVPADYDGDAKADITVFRPSDGVWYRLNSTTGEFVARQFGVNGDKPSPGDFDGDRKADISVFRPSDGTWYRLLSSNNQFAAIQFGTNGDKAVPADYDGDGKTDIAVYRASTGSWYRISSSTGQFTATKFGITEDKPVAADYDGDGKADLAVFRPAEGNWYLLRSSAGFTGLHFGNSEDVPVPNAFVR